MNRTVGREVGAAVTAGREDEGSDAVVQLEERSCHCHCHFEDRIRSKVSMHIGGGER